MDRGLLGQPNLRQFSDQVFPKVLGQRSFLGHSPSQSFPQVAIGLGDRSPHFIRHLGPPRVLPNARLRLGELY